MPNEIMMPKIPVVDLHFPEETADQETIKTEENQETKKQVSQEADKPASQETINEEESEVVKPVMKEEIREAKRERAKITFVGFDDQTTDLPSIKLAYKTKQGEKVTIEELLCRYVDEGIKKDKKKLGL